ncbi:hypothetical protein [Fictibacillus barbaricus]|uniref:Uncharacterized protein n=1 Tax=Fictibacillus barbaricus TaxID=182136 RepID=A0ABS2ZBB2_9BACL|nr:hypothetical protein [Fictibacillus barbaricus]MBN3545493.1 hypothetical protein [Fictibacillus barbaricus]GGB53849.1 hypothetical protein GCM10007199_19420 [Fictibacillus barbaricus]
MDRLAIIFALFLGLIIDGTNASAKNGNSQENPQTYKANKEDIKKPKDEKAIHPFHVNVPEAELIDLRRRINATR